MPLNAAQRARLTFLWKDYDKLVEETPHKPTFSVITPSYNQAQFLNETLDSVAKQTHRPVEHIVFDPGSTDGSREIASLRNGVTLVAEPDEGQSDAVNKGFVWARGDIIAWLNSDDCFFDEKVFAKIAQRFEKPDKPDIVYGKGIYIDENGKYLRDVYINKKPETLAWRLQQEDGILQPAVFMKREVIEKVGLLAKHHHFCMDYEYWIRCIKAGFRFAYVDENLARARYHTSNKTYGSRDKSYLDVCDMLLEQFGYVNHNWLMRYAEYLSDGFDGVLANAANSKVENRARMNKIYIDLMRSYNTNADTIAKLAQHQNEAGYGDTKKELERLSLMQNTPCESVALDEPKKSDFEYYTVGPRRWAFDKKWKSVQIEKAHAFLRNRIDSRQNDTCVIVGNGPSLNNTDLSLLEGQDVIISNNSFLSPELMKYASYYTVVNYLVAEQSYQHINQMDGVDKILPYWLSYCLNEGPNSYFIDAVGHPEFSTDIFKNASWRHTVTFFNFHVAYGLGYKKVILIGMDHSYEQKTGIKEGEIVLSSDNDSNHLTPIIFRGKRWQAADVERWRKCTPWPKRPLQKMGGNHQCHCWRKPRTFPASRLARCLELSRRRRRTK